MPINAAGKTLAIIVRHKSQHASNLIMLAHGLTIPSACAAATEAHLMIEEAGRPREGLGRASMVPQGKLEYTQGQVIAHNSWRVIYQRVHHMYIFAILPVTANALKGVAVLERATSILISTCKTSEITYERLHAKYAELYASFESLLRHDAAAFAAPA
eukprot:CAMPEP_0114316128 /NCGR_PEP_ID=MMETSP0059-20121206/23010_1 /TAXON_ID=36894 /ORGANISM="Pyramimonas parkeae, Strain CCMP726" /LENGTH=157 /DNA_ID=CAMNT_0001441983 /DNA_START=165 /DNA_END=635 /DNA_ORIENTATION=+